MSGPKISEVELAARRRRQIAEQRNRNESLLKASISNMRLELMRARHATAGLGQYQAEALRWIDGLEKRYVSVARQAATLGYPQHPEIARAFNDWVEGRLAEITDDLRDELADKSATWQQEATSAQELAELESLSQSLDVAGTERAIEVGADLVARLLAASAPAKETPVLERAGECLSDIQALVLDEAVPATGKRSLMGMAPSINEALLSMTKDPSQLVALRESVEAAQAELIPIRRAALEKRSLYDLCESEAARIASLTGDDCPIPRLGQLSALEDVRALFEELRRRAIAANEEAYIAQAIDQVMERHGYRVKRSVRLAPNDDRLHDLYLDEDSDDGIRCYRGTGGALMFETGSVDDSVRSCETGEVVERYHPASEQERSRLLVRQEAFCELYPQIVDELAELGVVVRKRRHLPPSQESSFAFATADARAADPERENAARRTRTAKRKPGSHEREAR
ncbi:MAG: hypothetical protein Q4B54_10865 [Coriobacteriales bacterium]|nr:hypothetical protein [Coriobacteriales bacterium]